jgi:hypothetical protein
MMKPAVCTFCHCAISQNRQTGDFVAVQNPHTVGMTILQRRKISIPAVSSPCAGKKVYFCPGTFVQIGWNNWAVGRFLF